MTEFLRAAYRRVTTLLKFSYLWVARILFAPDHFRVGLINRLHWAICGGYMCDQVHLYRLNEGTCSQYLSEFDWYRSRVINAPYDTMLNNKVLCAQMLEPFANVPEVLYFMEKGHIVRAHDAHSWATPEEVLATIRAEGRVFIKPISSGKGKGVHLLGHGSEGYTIDLEPVTENQMLEQISTSDWHICKFAKQGAFLDAIFPDVANTVRAITMRDPATGKYKLFFAVLRIGTCTTVPVDNGSKGGLVAKIDLATGELSEARSIQADVKLDKHPDTGATIKGACIPDWEHVVVDLEELASHLPFVEFVAWDILLQDEGFAVIEANASSGVNIIQIWGGQRQAGLGDFYRAHGILK